jgi:hypothetical protein
MKNKHPELDFLWSKSDPKAPEPEPETVPAREPELLPDPSQLPAEFARATMMAVKRVQTILAENIPDDDENFGVRYRAQAAVASAQTGHQLRSDETALKARAINANYYHELKQALEDFRAGHSQVEEENRLAITEQRRLAASQTCTVATRTPESITTHKRDIAAIAASVGSRRYVRFR